MAPGYIDGMSLYEYVGSNPINYLDPLGLWRFWDWVLRIDTKLPEEEARLRATYAREQAERLQRQADCEPDAAERAQRTLQIAEADDRMAERVRDAAMEAAAEGVVQGAGHGGQIALNAYTLGLTDAFGLTEANALVERYGGSYRAAQASAEISAIAAYAALSMRATQPSAPKGAVTPKYGATPEGRPFTKHYGTETGPQRNIPGSVVDNTINTTKGVPARGGKMVHYDPVNDVTVVTGDGGSIVSVHRGKP